MVGELAERTGTVGWHQSWTAQRVGEDDEGEATLAYRALGRALSTRLRTIFVAAPKHVA